MRRAEGSEDGLTGYRAPNGAQTDNSYKFAVQWCVTHATE